MDLSFHTPLRGEKMMILHLVDEASSYHTPKILKEATCANYSELGSCQAHELIEAISDWTRHMGTP